MFKQKGTQNLIKEKGITLIALIITIIVLVILAAVSINAAYNSGIVNYAVNGTGNYVEAAEKEKSSLKNAQSLLENALFSTNPFVEDKGVNTPKITDGMIPIKWNGTNWVVCARDDADWYNYTETKMEWANMMLSDGKYKASTVQVGQVVQDSDLGSMFVWIPRYAYSMTHYKTSFTGTADSNNGTTQEITNVVFLKGTSNEDAEGNRYARNYDADEQTVGEETDMIVHPAFNFGGQELTGIWVAKFEASMKEDNTNATGNNNVTTKTVKILPNKESWRYINIGNIFTTCLNMKNNSIYGLSSTANTHLMKNTEWGAVAYLAASQYGKIPVFSNGGHTQDGDIHHAYTAGSSTAGAYVTNKSQSTTGTVHGVYDMNGGAWEYVAAYWDNGSSNLGNGNITGLTMFDSTNSYALNSAYTAYWDKYKVDGDDGAAGFSAKNNEIIAKAAYERVQEMKSIKGDAMYEIIRDILSEDEAPISFWGWLRTAYTSNGWIKAKYTKNGSNITVSYPSGDTSNTYATGLYGGDYVLIGTSVSPFVGRGGYWVHVPYAGVFSSYGIDANTGGGSGFRPALVV